MRDCVVWCMMWYDGMVYDVGRCCMSKKYCAWCRVSASDETGTPGVPIHRQTGRGTDPKGHGGGKFTDFFFIAKATFLLELKISFVSLRSTDSQTNSSEDEVRLPT